MQDTQGNKKCKWLFRLIPILALGLLLTLHGSGCGYQKTDAPTPPTSTDSVRETLPGDQPQKEDAGLEEPETEALLFAYGPLPSQLIKQIDGVSWYPEAPVGLEDLALVELTHWGFDQQVHRGQLIVHRTLAQEVVEIFEELFEAGFPLESVRLIDGFAGDDYRSMAANNTSALNVREVEGGGGRMSRHSYGVAIDLNPVQNPYIRGSEVLPETGRAYLDRTDVRPGMIVEGDMVHDAFVRRGWIWGGTWQSLKDYQHFEKPLE